MVTIVKTNEQVNRSYENGTPTETVVAADYIIKNDGQNVGNAHYWNGGFSFSVNSDASISEVENLLSSIVSGI